MDNGLILENFQRLVTRFPHKDILVRTPVIPEFNDTQDVLTAIAALVCPFPQVRYEPLPYHRLGTQKYTFIGKTCPMGDVRLDNEFFK